ncbi:hypothetical protein EI94DRAFT_1704188 [Lactarius quietus]|nr:hypothetical protein EI94DRAFT_1704188 [Lactarius quietus]
MLAISTATLLSVLALASSLTGAVQASGPRPVCTETYDITSGATCDSIAGQVSLTTAELQSLNPTTDCSSPLTVGGRLCIQVNTPACTNYATATDTSCDGLAAQYGLSATQFVAYNDDVNNDCSNLVVGQNYCVTV